MSLRTINLSDQWPFGLLTIRTYGMIFDQWPFGLPICRTFDHSDQCTIFGPMNRRTNDHSEYRAVPRPFTYRMRKFHAVGVCTAHLPRTYCVMFARRSHDDFLTCSTFDGARSARGVCLAHLGDSTAYVWQMRSVAYRSTAYLLFYFVRRASTVAPPASGTGA